MHFKLGLKCDKWNGFFKSIVVRGHQTLHKNDEGYIQYALLVVNDSSSNMMKMFTKPYLI
jgi:hypothetical protein